MRIISQRLYSGAGLTEARKRQSSYRGTYRILVLFVSEEATIVHFTDDLAVVLAVEDVARKSWTHPDKPGSGGRDLS